MLSVFSELLWRPGTDALEPESVRHAPERMMKNRNWRRVRAGICVEKPRLGLSAGSDDEKREPMRQNRDRCPKYRNHRPRSRNGCPKTGAGGKTGTDAEEPEPPGRQVQR